MDKEQIYNQVSQNILNNLPEINNFLENSKIASNTNGFDKLQEIAGFNPESLIKNETKTDYHDLNEIDELFNMFDDFKKNQFDGKPKKPKKAGKFGGSASSLASGDCAGSTASINATNEANVKDICDQIRKIQEKLDGIESSSIQTIDLSKLLKARNLEQCKFIDLSDFLRKQLVELQLMVKTAKEIPVGEVKTIDDNLNEKITDLNKVNYWYSC